MEILVASGLVGVGLLLQNDSQENNSKMKKTDIFNNNLINNNESKLVEKNFNKININPNIIPRCYNRKIMVNKDKDFIYSKWINQYYEIYEIYDLFIYCFILGDTIFSNLLIPRLIL